MVPPPTGRRIDGRRRRRAAGAGGPERLGGPRPYGKIRHEDTSKAVMPIRSTADTTASAP
jgi:hypothetical protein